MNLVFKIPGSFKNPGSVHDKHDLQLNDVQWTNNYF